ncbi:unnamed protein product [Prorocentrum cordatum]|uniref:Uncharacterized protein n=1 Tax=Prorocentrum cordatum TaxID=2364126 RepID=A0ABN9PSR9_9DINO|nr:unnamed protein product [Polarella glacialis]
MAWLTSVLQGASSVTSSVVAGAIGGLAAGGRCDCHCEWSAAPDHGFLQVCPALPPPPVTTLALVGVGLFLAGVLFGACLVIGEARLEWFSQLQRGSRVLVRYEGYPLWHERLLVARLAPSRWVVATPSGDIYDEDLMESDGVHRVGPLGGFGAGMANVEVFRFVNLAAQEKRELLEAGEDYVRDNEGDLDIDAESRQVLVAQHVLPPRGGAGPGAAPAPGEAGVPAAALPGAAAGVAGVAAESRRGFTLGDAVAVSTGQLLASGDRGVFTVPGAGPLCVAAAGSLSSGAGEGGLRTLPVRFDRSNRRFREYGDAVVCFSETAQAGWSVAGPRTCSTCKWLLQEHAYISKVLERACVFDQLKGSELETSEVLSGRYQLWGELRATELRAAEAGEGGDGRLLGAALVCPALEEHAAGKLAQVVGSGMASGPQPPDDRPRDLLPFAGGRALDELHLGTTGGGLSAAGNRKAWRRRVEEARLRSGLDALSELGGGGRASSDAQATAAQASAVRPLAKLYGERGLQCMLAGCSGLLRDPAEAQAALRELGPAMALDPVLRLMGLHARALPGGAELLDKGILEKATVVKETAGAFFVKRKDGLLRLIFDTGRSNCHFAPPLCTSLASGESLADLESEPGARLWAASADVEICFYQCELPASLRPLFVLPPILARHLPARWRKWLGLAEGDDECAFQARGAPMGWARAVHFIQRAHEHLLLCYIDNLAVISDNECEAVNGVAHMLMELDGAGVKAHLDKPDPSSGSLELLGFEHVAHQRLWRPAPETFWRVAKALEYVLRAGATPSGPELERLVGHLVSMMMPRRDLWDAAGRPWPSARRDLRWAHALLPTIVARSDLKWLLVVTAHDASEWVCGAAESLRGSADAGRARRLRERARFRGPLATAGGSQREHARLHGEEELLRLPDAAVLLSGGHAHFQEVPRELLRGDGWAAVAPRAFRRPDSIHNLEAAALTWRVRRAARALDGAAMEARRLATALAGRAPAEAPPRAAHRQRSRSPEARLQRTLNSEGAAGLDCADSGGLGARSRLPPRPGRPTRGLGALRPPRSPPAPSPGLAAEVGIKRLAPRLPRLAQNSARPPTQVQYARALMELAGWLAVTPLPEWAASTRGEHLSDFLSVLFDRGGGPHAGKLIASALPWALPPLGLTMRSTFPLTHQTGLALLGGQVIRPIGGMPGALGQATIVLHPEDLGAPSKTGLVEALDLPEHQWVGHALLKRKERRAPLQRLCPISRGELLAEMKRAAAAVGCEVLRPTPRGLRRGGASRDKALGRRSLGDTQLRGKRGSPLGAQRYQKQAGISEQLKRLALEGKVFLEVFVGAGRLSQALRRRGAAVMSIDARRGPRRDLRAQEVFNVVKGSRAPAGSRMPAALRPPQQPRGLAGLPPRGAAKLAEGNALADRAGQLARLALEREVPGGEENPAQPHLWALPSRGRFLLQPNAFDVVVDYCAAKCTGRGTCSFSGQPHIQLAGKARGDPSFRTVQKNEYPPQLRKRRVARLAAA